MYIATRELLFFHPLLLAKITLERFSPCNMSTRKISITVENIGTDAKTCEDSQIQRPVQTVFWDKILEVIRLTARFTCDNLITTVKDALPAIYADCKVLSETLNSFKALAPGIIFTLDHGCRCLLHFKNLRVWRVAWADQPKL